MDASGETAEGQRTAPARAAVAARCAVAVAIAAVGGPAAAAQPTEVTIAVHRDAVGDVWSASGAIVDSGTMADSSSFFAGSSGTYHGFRTF